jgi:hypothetical protein
MRMMIMTNEKSGPSNLIKQQESNAMAEITIQAL